MRHALPILANELRKEKKTEQEVRLRLDTPS